MKAMKIIYRVLYILLGIGWFAVIAFTIYGLYDKGGYGIMEYVDAILTLSLAYIVTVCKPLLLAVVLHIIYKIKLYD